MINAEKIAAEIKNTTSDKRQQAELLDKFKEPKVTPNVASHTYHSPSIYTSFQACDSLLDLLTPSTIKVSKIVRIPDSMPGEGNDNDFLIGVSIENMSNDFYAVFLFFSSIFFSICSLKSVSLISSVSLVGSHNSKSLFS